MTRSVRNSEDVFNATVRVLERISSVAKHTNDSVLVMSDKAVVTHTRLQTIFNLKFEDELEQVLHNIVVSHAHKAEKLGPGGFDRCIDNVTEILKSHESITTKRRTEESLRNILKTPVPFPSAGDIDWVVNKYASSASLQTRAMLKVALSLAGFAGRIVVEKTKNAPSVELMNGYVFDHSAAWACNDRLIKPRVFCIDGYVESVSVLHHLLEEASETKEHVLLCARGLSNDVLNTLKVNFDRRTLNVVPLIVKFDLAGMNSLNDIAVVCGTDVVSSNKGQLISSLRLKDASTVDEIVVTTNKVSILNRASRRNVSIHVKMLLEKRAKEEVEDVQKLLDDRIKSLSPSYVLLRLTDNMSFVKEAQSIDYVLRAIRSLVDYGVIGTGDDKSLTSVFVGSLFYADKCVQTINSVGACVFTSSDQHQQAL